MFLRFMSTSALIIILSIWSPGAARAYSGESYVVCKLNPYGDNFLAMRACGSSKCQMLRKLQPDTFLLTMEPRATRGWHEVMILNGLQDESYSGATGWVYAKYICKIDMR